MTGRPSGPRRGRPAAASRADVLGAATTQYLNGRRIDVQALAGEVGVGRTTVYRWFGSREALIGEVLVGLLEPLVAEARAAASGTGPEALLDTCEWLNRRVAEATAWQAFLDRERETALRIVTSDPTQRRIVDLVRGLIEHEARAGAYDPPMDPESLAYALVRLAEAFAFSDDAAARRGDVARLREVEAALLGAPSAWRSSRDTG
jgi:AcrR family transcriptional regulator